MRICLFFFVAVSLFSISCQESLPPRIDPGNVFVGTLTPQYIVTESENTIRLCIHFKNIYDETLQAPAFFKGSLTIYAASDTSYKKTLFVSGSDIAGGKYDPATNIITADPESSYAVRVLWNFIDDKGRDVRTLFHYGPADCGRDTATGEFIVGGSLIILDRTLPINFPVQFFARRLTDRWVMSSYDCPKMGDDDNCF